MRVILQRLALLLAAPLAVVALPSTTLQLAPVVANSQTQTQSPTSSSTGEPCASIFAAQTSTGGGALPTVPAQMAYACQRSVPFDAIAAQPWLNNLKPYMMWQTTPSYLKNPPKGYLSPAVDVFAELDNVISDANNGRYKAEYDFEWDLYKRVFVAAHDGHFSYTPSMVGLVFAYFRTEPLVSISPLAQPNASSVPRIYAYSDIAQGLNPPAVTLIDGQDAEAFLDNLSKYNIFLHDPDAQWNSLFYSFAGASQGGDGVGNGFYAGDLQGANIYPGPRTSLTFANGTTRIYENYARVLVDFSNIRSAQDLYKTYIAPTGSSTAPPQQLSTGRTLYPPRPHYPTAQNFSAGNAIAGYYLSAHTHNDTAVLAVPSFLPGGGPVLSYSQIAQSFLQQAHADGKTRLIIDISGNQGGDVMLGYDLYKLLFPFSQPWSGQRFRAHEGVDIMGQEVSGKAGPQYPWPLGDRALNTFYSTPFNYRADINSTFGAFTSWQDKYGPHQFNGDNFSSIINWNISDIYSTILPVAGTGQVANEGANQQYFTHDNMVILTDGACASTCSVFTQLMTSQGNVTTIAVGGRPQRGPMQAVGGTRGTNDYTWSFIYSLVQSTSILGDAVQRKAWNSTELGTYSTYPLTRAVSYAAVNFRDGLVQGDSSQTPLQFQFQAADCRIWLDQYTSVEDLWSRVAETKWNPSRNACSVGQS